MFSFIYLSYVFFILFIPDLYIKRRLYSESKFFFAIVPPDKVNQHKGVTDQDNNMLTLSIFLCQSDNQGNMSAPKGQYTVLRRRGAREKIYHYTRLYWCALDFALYK